MNGSQSTIGIFPLFSALILAIGLMNHVLVIPPLLQEAKRDAWLAVAGAAVPFLLWISLLGYIMRSTGQQPILSWLKQRYGTPVSFGFRLFFIVYLLLISMITLRETTMWTHTSYLPRTPMFVLSFTFLALCLYAAYRGMRAIAISSGILLPFVIIFGDFVMSANLPEKNYGLLTPVLEHGALPALEGSVFVGGGLAELFVIVLMQHHFKSRMRMWALWLLGLFLVVLIIGPLTGAIAEFGPFEAARLRYPAYEEWRLVKIGKYITHVDFLSIYQWLSGAVIRIALAVYLIVEAMSLRGRRLRLWSCALLGLLVIVPVQFPYSDMQYLVFLKEYYFPISLIGVAFMSFLLLLLVLLAKKKEVRTNDTGHRRN